MQKTAKKSKVSLGIKPNESIEEAEKDMDQLTKKIMK